MYTKRVQIPQPGKRESLPSVEGEAIDVLRLDWLGAEDPLGNPRVRADAGRIDQPLSERHPIRQNFRGLEIVNEDNQKAAGTVALLRIYEDARNVLQTQPRRQPTIQGAENLKHEPFSGEVTLEDGSQAGVIDLLGDTRDVAYRATLYVILEDDGMSGGYSNVKIQARLKSSSYSQFNGLYTSIGVGETKGAQIGKDVIVPKDEELQVSALCGGDGDGPFTVTVEGLALYDPKTQVPPR